MPLSVVTFLPPHLSFHVTITIDANCSGLGICQGLLHCDSPLLGLFPSFAYCVLFALLAVILHSKLKVYGGKTVGVLQ